MGLQSDTARTSKPGILHIYPPSIYCVKYAALKNITFIFIGFFICSQASPQHPYQHLVNKTYAQRVEPLQKMYGILLRSEDSATVFRRIDTIRQLANKYKDEDLLMEVSLMQVHYYYYRGKAGDEQVLLRIKEVQDEAVKKKKAWAEIVTENMLALYNYDKMKRYEVAFEHHLRVFEMVKDLSPAEFPHKQNCYQQMANEYYAFNDFKQAIFYNRLALEAQPLIKLHPQYIRIDILNTIGLAYQQMQQLDSSELYFRQAYDLAVKMDRRAWQGISSGNLGYNHFLRKRYAEAIPLIEKDVTIAEEINDLGLACGSLMVLADISLLQHDYVKAGRLLEKARSYAYSSGQYKRLQRLYPLLSKWYSATGNTALASLFLDSSLAVKDSLNRQFNALQMLRAGQRVEIEKRNAEIASLQSQQKLTGIQRNFLIVILALLLLTGIWIYRNQRRKFRDQQAAVKRKEMELAEAGRQLDDFALNISEKNALIEMLEEQYGNETNATLQKIRESTILTDEHWEYFRGLFEKVHSGFLQRLKNKIPGLTPAETRFIALSKLGLSVKEMSSMLGISTDAVRKIRSRTKKKLNLEEDAGFDDILSQV